MLTEGHENMRFRANTINDDFLTTEAMSYQLI